MSLNANNLPYNGGSKSEPIEPGVYPGRVIRVIDLGVQPNRSKKYPDRPPMYQIRMEYELPTVFMKDAEGNDDEARPRIIGEDFNFLSMKADKATSTKRMKAIDPKNDLDGNFSLLVGRPCTVTVVNSAPSAKGIIYSNVGGVASGMKGMPVPEAKSPSYFFDLDVPDMEVWESLPDFIKKKIREGIKFESTVLAHNLADVCSSPKKETMAQETGEVDECPW